MKNRVQAPVVKSPSKIHGDLEAFFNQQPQCPDEHDYFSRFDTGAPLGVRASKSGNLYAPGYDIRTGELVAIARLALYELEAEEIFAETEVDGAAFSIGTPCPGGAICITSGLAAGATLHQHLGTQTLVTFTVSNFLAAIRAVQERYQSEYISVYCESFDEFSAGVYEGILDYRLLRLETIGSFVFRTIHMPPTLKAASSFQGVSSQEVRYE